MIGDGKREFETWYETPHETCPLTGKPFEELHALCKEKLQTLRSVHGLRVFVMREHEWLQMTKSNPVVQDFLKRYNPPQPLYPRDAFYGGRTSPVKLRYTAAANETVQTELPGSVCVHDDEARAFTGVWVTPEFNKALELGYRLAFTTAYSRLTLYSYLQQLQDRVLYFDTDSLIYVSKEGESQLKLGNYLGDLTDELKGDSIVEFAAAGPKSYAYKTKNYRVSMRVKGITQTHE
ncbi:hypothetical protein F2P81_025272 [Scophthalmus maximus]|uniref:Uncharacterized protein n=1 Tax=Scophthalmus maximus TaxID=52904 RepID=A0A6A4RQ92_SCOMX|nr:hypothetical protein F2P81_025272 [Scophthalmus maximus]